MSRRALRAAAPAILLVIAVLTPFLDKAFTIDDPLFLYQAGHVLQDPVHPTAFEVVWSTAPQRMSAIMASGPGMAYLLVPCVALGGAEWVAHLIQLAALLLALLATASLSDRLGGTWEVGRLSAFLLAATPAVLAMAGTAMPDVPAMAFGVCGIERAVAWSQDRRWHQALLASLALAAAALCRSHLIVLPGIAWLLCIGDVFDTRVWSRRLWAISAPPVATLALVAMTLFATRDPRGSVAAVGAATQTFFFGPAILRNAVSYLAHWAVVLPLGLPWLLIRPRRILGGPVFYAAAAAAWLYVRSTPEVGPVAVAPLAGLGAAALWDLLFGAVRRRDSVTLILGLWMLTPLAVLPYLHLPSKYLLMAAPASAMAVARTLAAESRRRARVVIAATVTLGVILGVLVLRADAASAGLGRRAARTLVAPQVAEGRTVWFNGHWGFQWYAEQAGAKPLTSTPPRPQWGDLVVSSLHAENELMGAMPHRRLVQSLELTRPGGRIMSRSEGAGFYSNGWGYLPWAWGSEPMDRYELWSIE